MKRLERIREELNKKLNKKYGEYGNIICTIENDDHVKVNFEENYYLYDGLYDEKVYDFIDGILKKYDTYFELENSCIMTIF